MTGRRLAIVAVVVGLLAAACGSSDDVVVSQTDSANADAAPADTDADADAAPFEEAVGIACPTDDTTDVIQQFDAMPPNCLEDGATYSALVSTTAGDITIDLDAAVAPITVNNFVFLARYNYFDNTVCHRVIQDFVVQCGDPDATGFGGPGYTFPDELPADGAYEVGSIAMANSGPNTNGSQFFIISGPNGAGLPPLYSLFGQVPGQDLGVVTEMNALGSLDSSGIPSEEVRILDVTITQS